MASLFDDPPTIHDQDAVGRQHRGEPMGDDECGAALHHVVERFLHQHFILGVQRGGGLVKQQDRRILENGAGDGETLALAAREGDAALAELCVQTFRQRA